MVPCWFSELRLNKNIKNGGKGVDNLVKLISQKKEVKRLFSTYIFVLISFFL